MNDSGELTDLLLDDRIDGLSYDRIGKKHGIDPLDARAMVREALSRTADEDEWEMRALSLLRLEKVVQHMWTGVEQGSFKHAEALFKGLDQINTLLALNKQVVEERRAAISEEQAELIYLVIKENNRQIRQFIGSMKLNKTQQALMEEWPVIESEASTKAIEAVLVEDEEEES